MKKYRALQIVLELAEGNMIEPEYACDDDERYDLLLEQSEAYSIVYKMIKEEIE